jgi:hypothetical protein
MRVDIATRDVRPSPEVIHSGFGIEDEALIFGFMSDKIYTDKPRAVVRELACNALDTASVFKISTPSPLEPMFVVRDYGPGITHEFMMGRYTKLGASTKRDENTSVGGFGVGRLAPLALTDTYTVTTFIDGVKRTYVVFKGANGIPQVSLGSTMSTNEANGTEVRVAIRSAEFTAFKTTCEDVLKWFPAGSYEPFGFKVTEPEWLIKAETWGLRKGVFERRYDYATGRHIDAEKLLLMGPVAYGVDWKMIQSDMPASVVPFAGIGTMDLPPGRETLSYNTATLAEMKRISAQIESELPFLARKMALAMDPWDRCAFVAALKTANVATFMNGGHSYEPFTDMTDGFILDGGAKVYSQSYSYMLKRAPDEVEKFRLNQAEVEGGIKIVFDDLKDQHANTKRVYARLDNHGGKKYVLLKGYQDFDQLKALFGKAPNFDFLIKLSDCELPEVTTTPGAVASAAAYQMRLLVTTNSPEGFYQANRGDVPTAGDLWWPFNGNDAEEGISSMVGLRCFSSLKIWGLTKTAQAAIDTTQLIKLDQFVQARATELSADPTVVKGWADLQLRRSVANEITTTLYQRPDFGVAIWPKLEPVREFMQTKPAPEVGELEQLIAKGFAPSVPATKNPAFARIIQATHDKSPLLKLAVIMRQDRNLFVLSNTNDALLKEIA